VVSVAPTSTSRLALVGSSLRTVVVTLDPEGRESRADSPAYLLRSLGHEVIVSGFDLLELEARTTPADVVIVEAGEHLEIGRSAIQRLRQRPELIAARILLCLEVARVMAFTAEIGADDFILFPVSQEELAARLWQLRARDSRPRAPLQLRYGDIVLDCEMRQAYRDEESLKLTPYEFQLLRFFVERINRVFSRQELLSRVWGYRHAGGGRTVDTHTLNLRRKLGELGERLQSVLGVGYKLQKADGSPERPLAADRAPTMRLQSLGTTGAAAAGRSERPRDIVPPVPAPPYDFDLPMRATRRSS
jgi:two-component system OmpR family response regulator/two-component system alkaline phosphatase synthesis response regulator PhoP